MPALIKIENHYTNDFPEENKTAARERVKTFFHDMQDLGIAVQMSDSEISKTDIHELTKPCDDLPPCDPDIYKDGIYIGVVSGGTARLIQRFVREVADYSGQPVDWHYVGGRAQLLTNGDAAKVREAIMLLQLHVGTR